jgi:hypothetical protein
VEGVDDDEEMQWVSESMKCADINQFWGFINQIRDLSIKLRISQSESHFYQSNLFH